MGSLNKGGMYKRMMNETIRSYVMVDDIDEKIAMVEKLGGKIDVPKRELESVGQFAVIEDIEGNAIVYISQKCKLVHSQKAKTNEKVSDLTS